MSWRTDTQATRAAREAFPEHTPKVLRDGRQYLINPTPFGRVELLRIGEGFLVAAQDPPPPPMDPSKLPARLRRHLEIHGLRPWKIVGSNDCSEAIRSLVGAGWNTADTAVAHSPEDDGRPTTPFSPYICPIQTSAELLGENRILCCLRAAGLVASERQPGPLAQIVGPDGIGKRTMAATLAQWLGWSLVGELPLGRLLVERILQTPAESLLDTLLGGGAALGADDLLVVSDAELLRSIDGKRRPTHPSAVGGLLLRELARLPHVVLLARPGTVCTHNVVSLGCPGMESIEDARAMVSAAHPELEFVGAAFELLARAATAAFPSGGHASHAPPEWAGIVPGRLLYLVRLTKALLSAPSEGHVPHALPMGGLENAAAEEDSAQSEADHDQPRIVLAPDEVSGALALASSVWKSDSLRQP